MIYSRATLENYCQYFGMTLIFGFRFFRNLRPI